MNVFPFDTLPTVTFPPFRVSLHEMSGERDLGLIQRAIAVCAAQGGGTVVVPAGEWQTGPLHFQSHICLHLEKGAMVRFSPVFEHYLPLVYSQRGGVWLYNYSPLLYARGAEQIGITGPGILDGSGEAWWPWKKRQPGMERLFQMAAKGIDPKERRFGTEEEGVRPPMLQFIDCRDIVLRDFTIRNSPSWTIHPVCCENVTLSGLTILGDGPNTDGIDPDSCRNVLIEDCFIDTGDDCLVLKAGRDEDAWKLARPTENVVVRRLTARRGHGGFVIGSEISAGVRNVLVEDCHFTGTDIGIRIKTSPGKGGYIENIRIRRVKMEAIRDEAILLTMAYGLTRDGKVAPWSFQSASDRLTEISDIEIEGVQCHGAARALEITGDRRLPIRHIRLKDISICNSGSGSTITHAEGVEMQNVSL